MVNKILLFIAIIILPGFKVLAQPPEGSNAVLIWSDEFSGTELEAEKWTDRGENYRKTRTHDGFPIHWRYEKDNAYIENGELVLRNTRITASGVDTVRAAAVSTINLFERTYGYYEARIKVAPTADGCHTAFWLQSKTMGTIGNGGSDGAEVDILESAFTSNHYQTAIHWDGYGSDHKSWGSKVSANVHDGSFHTYGLEWGPDYYKFYFDGQVMSTHTGDGVSNALEYIILSTGASWGEGNAHTGTFPNYAYIDYVRVYNISYDNNTQEDYALTDDTYIYGGDTGSSNTHGSENEIKVKLGATDPYTRIGYFKFEINDLSDSIKSVKFQATIKSKNDEALNTDYGLYLVDDDSWTEETLTWDNAPKNESFIATTKITENNILQWDVTSQILSNLSDGKLSLKVISSIAGPAYVNLGSKEAGTGAKLIIEMDTVATSIKQNHLNDIGLMIYPNPVADILNVKYHSVDNYDVVIDIYDISGRKRMELLTQVVPGKNILKIKFSDQLENGVYFLALNDGINIHKKKLIVNK